MIAMMIGEVAMEMNMSASTIRYYEKERLIPPARRVSGQRVYDPSIFDHLTFVNYARKAGFSIREIKPLVDELSPESRPGDRWRAVATEKLRDIDRQIEELTRMRGQLERLITCKCPSLHHFTRQVRETKGR